VKLTNLKLISLEAHPNWVQCSPSDTLYKAAVAVKEFPSHPAFCEAPVVTSFMMREVKYDSTASPIFILSPGAIVRVLICES
jgi:hypothetical protein